MSRSNLFPADNKRLWSKPSLRLYFNDSSIEMDYMHRMNEQFLKAAQRSHTHNVVKRDPYNNIDFYKRITPPRISLDTFSIEDAIDEVDSIQKCVISGKEISNRKKPSLKGGKVTKKAIRSFPKKQLRRMEPQPYCSTASSSSPDLIHKQFIHAIENNNVTTVESLLKSDVNPNLTYTLPTQEAEDLHMTIGNLEPGEQAAWTVLHEASSKGLYHCVRLLLDAGANPNAAGVKELTALDVAGSAYYYNSHYTTDSLTMVTKMLVEAGGKLSSANRKDICTPLHTATEIQSIETIKLLLDAGASVDRINASGLTPLHICLQKKSAEVLEILVNYNCQNECERSERVDVLDTHGMTVLQAAVVSNWILGSQVALEAGANRTYSSKQPKMLMWDSPEWYKLLQSRQTPIHLAVVLDHIEILGLMLLNAPEISVVNCFNQDGHTPLYTAIKQGRLECVKILIFEGASIDEVSLKNENALHVAAAYDQKEIMEFLLEYKDETEHLINTLNKQGCAPLHCAAMNNNPQCFKILLQNQADIRLKVFGYNSPTPLHIAAGCNYTSIVNIILDHDKTTIDEVDGRGFSPLHVAAHNCCHDVMLLLLNNGATLTSRTKGPFKESKTAIEIITDKLPNPTLFLEEVFDSCITCEDAFGMTKINVNFEVLGRINEENQMKAIEELVRCGQEKNLIHPMLESLLYFKWQTLLPFFYVILATYAFFVLSLNVLVVAVFYYKDKRELTPYLLEKSTWIVAVYISICTLVIQELFYLKIKRVRYFLYLETWLKLSSISLAAILAGTLCNSTWSEFEWLRHVATIALLLSWIEIMFLLSRFPSWGYYVLMFANVSVTIIKILASFVFLVVGFSISFMIQFQATPPFHDIWASLMKTMVMMTSEFDYVSLFNEDNLKSLSGSRTLATLLFLVFLLFVSIVFMNFMVGIAVSDITNLNIEGNMKRLGKLVELLSTLDVVVYDGALGKVIPRKIFTRIKNKRFVHKMSTFPGSEKTWHITCGNRLNKVNFDTDYNVYLPTYLGNAIMDKAKKVKQQKEEESIREEYLNKINYLFDVVTNSGHPVTQPTLETTLKDIKLSVETMSSEIAHMKLLLKRKE